ncbi:ribonuclease Z [Niallia sp. NCCP-28]|uniref:ribonuclease Z n=1 Tax=Niallia sp. NCCP-28 TaxID=2934712 RepID=UPI0020852939|nr:ribonuclease Z [Niallia sp. NCCP-28]GKU81099.1 ribonuclease Z [Niallia sp. NCCP-28]
MELQFLGTGAGIPAKLRNVTSIALKLLEERGSIWLFDAGEGTQHQILHTSIKPKRIEKIFITHLHGDHLYGLPGLLASRSFQGGEGQVTLYGPKGIKEYIETSLSISQTYLKYDLHIEEVAEGVIFEDDTFKVEALMLEHGIASYGYRITEKDLPGKLLVEKLQERGVKPGPNFKKIKNGEEVILADGTILQSSDFVGPPVKGRIVTILGDTKECEAAIKLAENATVLVHEATFAGRESVLAKEYFHSTTIQAANTAKKAKAEQLILTHISARYDSIQGNQLVEEAKEIFMESYLAEDFKVFPIPLSLANRE